MALSLFSLFLFRFFWPFLLSGLIPLLSIHANRVVFCGPVYESIGRIIHIIYVCFFYALDVSPALDIREVCANEVCPGEVRK
jgi:hypothetical protein